MTAVRMRGAAVGAACVGAAILAGCGSGAGTRPEAQKSTAPPTTPAATSSASPSFSPAEQAVIRAYVGFWKALAPASHATTPAEQLMLLTPVTTDPELSQLISGIANERGKGRAFYGADRPHVIRVVVSEQQANIDDCQDSSAAGVESLKTGTHLTVGVAAHPVQSTLVQRDGSWKVSTVSYPPAGTRC